MRQLHICLIIIVAMACSVAAQTTETTDTPLAAHKAVTSLNDYRPSGETRIWRFTRVDSLLGELSSQVMGTKDIEGREAHILKQSIRVDVGRPGTPAILKANGEHYVQANGGYLGYKRNQSLDDEGQQVDIYRLGDTLVGSVTRGELTEPVKYYFDYADPAFSFDQLYLDELEMFFAMHDFKVGDTIREDVFIPPVMLKGRFLAIVSDWVQKPWGRGTVDSVFQIEVRQPRNLLVYFTRDNRLVQAAYRGQQLVAYQYSIENRVNSGSQSEGFTFRDIGRLIPAYFLYLIFGAIALAFFATQYFRSSRLYVALAAGAFGFIAIPLLQTPLQMWLFEDVLLPKLAVGGSPYFWSIFPALAAGIIQTAVIVVVMGLLMRFTNPGKSRYVALTAAIAVGLGIVEACHQAAFSTGDLFTRSLLERAFMILFHCISGGLIGWGLMKGWRSERWIIAALIVVAANSFLRYLPIFVQQQVIDIELMYIILPATVVVMLFATQLVIKKSK